MARMYDSRYDMSQFKIQKNNNDKIKKERQERVEKYILDINKKLTELAEFLLLDIDEELNNPTIQKIKVSQNQTPFDKIHFGDIAKKAIVDKVLSIEREEKIRKEAIDAAGITSEELSKTASEILEESKRNSQEELVKRMSRLAGINRGTPPPKTDWKRVDIDKSEKEKILKSLRANPKSNIFSKEFKWDTEEFLKPFKYLESSDKYNGPLIVSVVDNKSELEKYSKIDKLHAGINEMYFGKYVLISMYDITASNSSPDESKNIYMGLKFLSMAGRLELDCIGSVTGKIARSQMLSVIEYLDSMEILYDEDHDDLKK